MEKELTGNNLQQILFTEEPPTTKFLYITNTTRQELEHKFKNRIPKELKLDFVVSYVENKNDEKEV